MRRMLTMPHCAICGGNFLPGEVYFLINGQPICRDCMQYMLRQLLRRIRRQMPHPEAMA